MNNKQKGTAFERWICRELAKEGYWVHFLSPDSRGAQPFDIIAVKNGEAAAMDCKTSDDHIFRIGRLEENQVMAFDTWLKADNDECVIAVLHDSNVYIVDYGYLKFHGKVDLDAQRPWKEGVEL